MKVQWVIINMMDDLCSLLIAYLLCYIFSIICPMIRALKIY